MEDFTYQEIAGMIDHALLHPTLAGEELLSGCRLADHYGVATVCVKPCDVERAANLLESSKTEVCTVIGFPHGANLTEVKVMEAQKACNSGASEVDMVINVGKAMSGDWQYVEQDIQTVCETAHSYNAKLKVIFENDYLRDGGGGLNGDELKRKLCQICENANADWVKTSTGFGYAHQKDGTMATLGATREDVTLMVDACTNGTQIKAAGGVKNLSTLLHMRKIGATRIGTSSTKTILDECRERLDIPVFAEVNQSNLSEY